jgi:nickel/cobalt transporter (NicO) family protein
MPSFAELLQQGAGNAWVFIPSAILLGALHGLEPGHSKTLMAAFIVAIRGTVAQAVMLGVAATISHTAVVWAVALGGMYLWRGVAPEAFEPWFQLLSGVIIIAMALWMLSLALQDQRNAALAAGGNSHGDDHAHGHRHAHPHAEGAGQHGHDYDLSFQEGHGHSHASEHEGLKGLMLGADGYQDAHERAHAEDIRKRFTDRNVTNWQIIVFGLTGGLIPCPAAITVLLLCLQVKEITLGAVLVLCFSIGLAVTLVTVGAAAALATRHAASRMPWLSAAARRAPYISGILIIAVGVYVTLHGLRGLAGA